MTVCVPAYACKPTRRLSSLEATAAPCCGRPLRPRSRTLIAGSEAGQRRRPALAARLCPGPSQEEPSDEQASASDQAGSRGPRSRARQAARRHGDRRRGEHRRGRRGRVRAARRAAHDFGQLGLYRHRREHGHIRQLGLRHVGQLKHGQLKHGQLKHGQQPFARVDSTVGQLGLRQRHLRGVMMPDCTLPSVRRGPQGAAAPAGTAQAVPSGAAAAPACTSQAIAPWAATAPACTSQAIAPWAATAPAGLAGRGLAARLVEAGGRVRTVASWPADPADPAGTADSAGTADPAGFPGTVGQSPLLGMIAATFAYSGTENSPRSRNRNSTGAGAAAVPR